MSIFAEPSVTLCGAAVPDKYAVCCARAHGPDKKHVWVSVVEVERRLAQTFTPCRFAVGPFAEKSV